MILAMAAPPVGPVSMTIPFSSQSAARARTALASWLAARGSVQRVVDDARLVVTELVGNAVRHASPLVDDLLLVRWEERDSHLVLSVTDGGGTSEPRQVDAAPYDVTGRGLTIVDALTVRWWVERSRLQHTVHARLALD